MKDYSNNDDYPPNDQNTKNKIKFTAGDYITDGMNVLGQASKMFDFAFNGPSAKELAARAPQQTSYINGVAYQTRGPVDSQNIIRERNSEALGNTLNSTATGATTGAKYGGWVGGLVGGALGLAGGLFAASGDDVRDQIREANLLNNRENTYGMSTAASQAARNNYYMNAYNGKDAVETSSGRMPYGQNAWVSQGEGIWNAQTGDAQYVDHGPNDTARANLKPEDVVFGNERNPITGRKFKDDAAPLIVAKQQLDKKRPNPKGDGYLAKNSIDTYEAVTQPIRNKIDQQLSGLAKTQEQVHKVQQYGDMLLAYNGKDAYPKFKSGAYIPWYTDAIPAALGLGASIGQYLDASSQSVYKPNTFMPNPNTAAGLSTLAGLRVSGYPIEQQIRDAERRYNYGLEQSGGLSGAQKYLGRIANTNNVYANIADLNSKLQLQNNAYKAAWADAALKYGAEDARNRIATNQFAEEYYAKAHAAKQQGKQMATYNFLNNIDQYAANEFKRRQSNWMIGIYDQGTKDDQNDINNKNKPDSNSVGNYYSWSGYSEDRPVGFYNNNSQNGVFEMPGNGNPNIVGLRPSLGVNSMSGGGRFIPPVGSNIIIPVVPDYLDFIIKNH